MKRVFVLFLFLPFLLSLYAGKPVSKKKVQYTCKYIRKEDFKETNYFFTDYCHRTSDNIVNSPESAAMLAYIYVQNLFGKDVAKGEQPYEVSLVNDSIWHVCGNSRYYKKKKWKGSFIIAIDKRTGSLLANMHEK